MTTKAPLGVLHVCPGGELWGKLSSLSERVIEYWQMEAVLEIPSSSCYSEGQESC